MTRILVADDNPSIRILLQEVLEQAGYEVEVAAEGGEALARIAERPCEIVVTDLFMPGKDGIELIMDLRARHPSVRILAISGGGPGLGFDLLRPALRLGANRVLRKPVLRADLLKAVEEVLAEPMPETGRGGDLPSGEYVGGGFPVAF